MLETILNVAVAGVGAYAICEALRIRLERIRLERARAFYEGAYRTSESIADLIHMASASQGVEGREMCGGCGAYLPPDEILKCPGKSCFRFIKGIAPTRIVS